MYKCPNFSYVFFCFVQKLYPFLSCIVVVVYCRSEEGKKFGIIFTENQKIPKRWYFAWWHIRTRVCYNVVGLVGQNLFSRPPLAKQVRTTEAYCYNSISWNAKKNHIILYIFWWKNQIIFFSWKITNLIKIVGLYVPKIWHYLQIHWEAKKKIFFVKLSYSSILRNIFEIQK